MPLIKWLPTQGRGTGPVRTGPVRTGPVRQSRRPQPGHSMVADVKVAVAVAGVRGKQPEVGGEPGLEGGRPRDARGGATRQPDVLRLLEDGLPAGDDVGRVPGAALRRHAAAEREGDREGVDDVGATRAWRLEPGRGDRARDLVGD